jgi:hypothetical protein
MCTMPHFNPYGNPRPCVGCEHFAEYRAGGSIILCMYGGRQQVNAQPEQGCVHWVRAIGSDDEQKAKRRA